MNAVLEKVGIQIFVESIVEEDSRRTPMDFVGEWDLDARLQLHLEKGRLGGKFNEK